MNIPVKNCSSCGACANVCAKGAISLQLDEDGFYRPVIDDSLCAKCGACENACPWLKVVENPNKNSESPKTVAAIAKDEQTRLKSSSGGIFSVLARNILNDGGLVIGVAQLDSKLFGHIIVDNLDDLPKLQGSKYVQANPGLVYREIKKLLIEGRKVLFSGTPCQVAALYSVLGKKTYGNLWTTDIVCHGVPSVNLFQKFVDEIGVEQSSAVKNTVFRDKISGWKKYSVTHHFENGNLQTSSFDKSDYMRLFLSNICQNKSCAKCHYRKLPRIADITLGDYWNIAAVHPEMDDDKGTSVVLLNTNHGEELFGAIAGQIKQCDSSLEKAVAGNPCIVRSSKEHFRRYEFFTDLEKLTMEELVKKYCVRLPLYKIVVLKIKKLLLGRC